MGWRNEAAAAAAAAVKNVIEGQCSEFSRCRQITFNEEQMEKKTAFNVNK